MKVESKRALYFVRLLDCGPLPPPANGLIYLPSSTYGSYALYICHDEYHIEGDSNNRRCMPDGNWNDEEPACTLTGFTSNYVNLDSFYYVPMVLISLFQNRILVVLKVNAAFVATKRVKHLRHSAIPVAF